MSAIAVTTQTFDREVLNNKKPVLVDFWASWCGPCKMLSPIVEAFAQEHTEIAVCKVNVDENPELAMGYRISAIPALLLFKEGKLAGQVVGYQSKESIESFVKN